VRKPTLVIVCGPPGSGKTTLAHALARAIPCPAICRDEIKEGMAHGLDDFTPAPGDELTRRTLTVFFSVTETLAAAGVTVVAEAAFQDKVWRPNLEPLLDRVDLRIVRCSSDPDTLRARIAQHAAERATHADAAHVRTMSVQAFQYLAMDAPTIEVDTTDGYDPAIAEIVAFVNRLD
jgi:predicted kinase